MSQSLGQLHGKQRGFVHYTYVTVISMDVTYSLRCYLLNIPCTVHSYTSTTLNTNGSQNPIQTGEVLVPRY